MISEPSISVHNLQKQLHQILVPIVRIIEDPNGAQDTQLGTYRSPVRTKIFLLT